MASPFHVPHLSAAAACLPAAGAYGAPLCQSYFSHTYGTKVVLAGQDFFSRDVRVNAGPMMLFRLVTGKIGSSDVGTS